MTITNAFRQAVKNGNVIGIRIMMKDSLLVDLSFNEFDEMERIASQVCNIYDIHDGCELISSESIWDDNYMNEMMVDIVENFSRERVEHLKKVVRKLRPVSSTSPSAISSTHHSSGNSQQKYQHPQQRSYQEQKKHDQRSGSYREVKIAGGVVVGAVVGTVVGSAVATPAAVIGAAPVIGAAVGAVVGGVIAALATNGEH